MSSMSKGMKGKTRLTSLNIKSKFKILTYSNSMLRWSGAKLMDRFITVVKGTNQGGSMGEGATEKQFK